MSSRLRLKRKSNFRDSKLIVIACEGTKTEPRYFNDISEEFHHPGIHVEVVDRNGQDSSPGHVLTSLDDFKRDYRLSRRDELWLVIDRDGWTTKEIKGVVSQCVKKHYCMAISNPCFEIWLLLHFRSLDAYTESTKQALIRRGSVKSKKRPLEIELTKILGSYNKSNLDTSKFIPYIEDAITRAKQLDVAAKNQWPVPLSTRVYLIIESIKRKNR